MPSQNQPATYSIEDLLNSGVQPFPDVADEDLDNLGRAIGQGPLAIPISVTEDGVLVDGHQRLKAMAARGRKRLDAADVRVIEGATAANALDWAIRLNAARRHLTAAQKAELARQLQRQRNWSQARVAKAFGVKRPAVSQWLANYPATDDAGPTFVIGEDGKEYAVDERPTDRAPRHPWAPDGHAYKAVHKALRALQENETVAGLNPLQLAKLAQEIGDLIEAAEGLQNDIGEES